jgi:hypothetical protein
VNASFSGVYASPPYACRFTEHVLGFKIGSRQIHMRQIQISEFYIGLHDRADPRSAITPR